MPSRASLAGPMVAALLVAGCPGPPRPDIPECGPDTLAALSPLDLADLAGAGPWSFGQNEGWFTRR